MLETQAKPMLCNPLPLLLVPSPISLGIYFGVLSDEAIMAFYNIY